ncbi:hypothetical protein RvY_07799 [Ramazzottius varieornatus]|uniref:Uncharacterized protein n=1 Tax=Ramazzottius varieornatus TaxID=947166 RepID=A0A1D1V3I6_RAMVA|nr:hypothetical protein RvY_07799 [Ramazzottius varieornatus]
MSLPRRIREFNWSGYLRIVGYTQGALILGVGSLYYIMEYNQDLRYWMRSHHPGVLRTFYTLAEDIEKNFEVRRLDTEAWEKKDVLEKSKNQTNKTWTKEHKIQTAASKSPPPSVQ